MKDFLRRRFVVSIGKGGVGKTIVSLMLGRIAAGMGRRVLVCLANAPSRYRESLGGVVLDSSIRRISSHLYAVNIDPVAAREEYGLMVLKSRTLHRLVFGSTYVNSFLDAVPGLSEWAMVGKATYHALGGADEESSPFDMVIFDAPATGHGLDILRLPAAIVASVPGGRIREEALVRMELMSDPERCEIIPVSTLEDMPVNETIELVTALRRRELPVMRLVLNRVSQSLSTIEDVLGPLVGSFPDAKPVPQWATAASATLIRARYQMDNRQRIVKALGLPVAEIPEVEGGALDERALLHLTRFLFTGLSNHGG